MGNKITAFLFAALLISAVCFAQQGNYNGVESNLQNIYRLSNAQSRSISPENFTGAKGQGEWLQKEPVKILQENWDRAGK